MKRLTLSRTLLALLLLGVAVTAVQGINPLRAASEHLPVGIGMSSTEINCLPWDWFWLKNDKPEQIARGDMVQFRSKGLEPVVEDGTRLIKIVGAVAGDTYQTTARGLFINGHWYDQIRVPEAIETNEVQTVPPGAFLAIGITDGSFDSRYFGPVDQSEIIGTANPLFAPEWDTDYHSDHDEKLTHRLSVLLDGSGSSLGPGRQMARGRRADQVRR